MLKSQQASCITSCCSCLSAGPVCLLAALSASCSTQQKTQRRRRIHTQSSLTRRTPIAFTSFRPSHPQAEGGNLCTAQSTQAGDAKQCCSRIVSDRGEPCASHL